MYVFNVNNIAKQKYSIFNFYFFNFQNLHSLVLKQRKVKQLYDIKGGIYKMIYKSENTIKESLEKEHSCQEYIKYVLEKIDYDFPMLRNNIKRILLTLQIL